MNLPNVVLSKIWSLGTHVFANFRSRNDYGKAKWFLGGFASKSIPDGLIAETKAECEKARQAGYKPDEEHILEWLNNKAKGWVRKDEVKQMV